MKSSAWSVKSMRAGDSILTFVSVGRLLPVCKQVLCELLVRRDVLRGDTSRLVSSGLAGFTFHESECSFGRYLWTSIHHKWADLAEVSSKESSRGWWWSFGPSFRRFTSVLLLQLQSLLPVIVCTEYVEVSANLPPFCCYGYEFRHPWSSAPIMSRKNSPAFQYSVTGINFWSCLTPRCLQPACSPSIKCLACLSTLATLLDSALNCGKVSN